MTTVQVRQITAERYGLYSSSLYGTRSILKMTENIDLQEIICQV